MRDITKERVVYKPFEYPEAHDYWMKQQQAHWLHTEVPMMSDVTDWKQNLTDTEKLIYKINQIELDIKKNYYNSLNIVSDFIINTAK